MHPMNRPLSADTRKGSTSFGACEVRCWRWLFGNKIPVSLQARGRPHEAEREVHLIITMIKWIRTSRLSLKNSLSLHSLQARGRPEEAEREVRTLLDFLRENRALGGHFRQP